MIYTDFIREVDEFIKKNKIDRNEIEISIWSKKIASNLDDIFEIKTGSYEWYNPISHKIEVGTKIYIEMY